MQKFPGVNEVKASRAGLEKHTTLNTTVIVYPYFSYHQFINKYCLVELLRNEPFSVIEPFSMDLVSVEYREGFLTDYGK